MYKAAQRNGVQLHTATDMDSWSKLFVETHKQTKLMDRAAWVPGIPQEVFFSFVFIQIFSAKTQCHAADRFSFAESSIILPAVYSLENLRPVGAIPGFYCHPVQQPGPDLRPQDRKSAASEIAKEHVTHSQTKKKYVI